jgi:hypothetical protein
LPARSPRGENLVDQFLPQGQYVLEPEAMVDVGSSRGKPGTLLRVAHQAVQRRRERGHVLGWDQYAVHSMTNDVSRPFRAVEADGGQSASHGFGQGHSKSLGAGGEYEQVGGANERKGIRERAGKVNTSGQAQRFALLLQLL